MGAGSREKCRVLLKCFDSAPGGPCPNLKALDEDGQDKVGAWQKNSDLDGGASEADSMQQADPMLTQQGIREKSLEGTKN